MNSYSKLLEDLNRYCSPGSMLIINRNGALERLYCPFRVIVLEDVDVLIADQAYSVNAILISNDLLMLYVVKNRAYPYFFFLII
jgi:hypothetical protein